MSPRAELLEIVSQLKSLLISYPQIGLDPSTTLPFRLEKREVESRSGSTPGKPGEEAQGSRGVELPRISRQGATDPKPAEVSPEDLDSLRALIGDCQRCKLSQRRTNLVFGEGAPRARLVFVGEGPGAEEDAAGRPFVGEAGKLLTKIIENGMGLKREDVYICNVVKCRPPNNRDPEAEEIQTCLPFLKRQLAIIQPEVICTLGRIAAQSLLGREFKITQERGNWFSFMGTPLMATFHPAYILRNTTEERRLKGLVWEDVKKIMGRLGLKVKRNE